MTDDTLPRLTCCRCGHSWVRRRDTLPKVCPSLTCKSRAWMKPRRELPALPPDTAPVPDPAPVPDQAPLPVEAPQEETDQI